MTCARLISSPRAAGCPLHSYEPGSCHQNDVSRPLVRSPRPRPSVGTDRGEGVRPNSTWSRRHRFSGHVFQGRYRTELVEVETYLWTLSRYVHLNPVRGRLVEHPGLRTW